MLNETHLGSLRFGPGASDGIKIDEAGRLWATVPGGIAVIDLQTRRVLASVEFGTNTANLCFGDGGDVFVTGLWSTTKRHLDARGIDEAAVHAWVPGGKKWAETPMCFAAAARKVILRCSR